MSRRWARAVAILAVGAALLVGCGEARTDASDDLCAQYRELVEKVDSLEAIDVGTAPVEEVRDRAEAVREQLDAFQAVAEGRLDTTISALRTAVADLAAAVTAAGQDAIDTARPLLEDTADDVRETWARLQQVADVQCGEA